MELSFMPEQVSDAVDSAIRQLFPCGIYNLRLTRCWNWHRCMHYPLMVLTAYCLFGYRTTEWKPLLHATVVVSICTMLTGALLSYPFCCAFVYLSLTYVMGRGFLEFSPQTALSATLSVGVLLVVGFLFLCTRALLPG